MLVMESMLLVGGVHGADIGTCAIQQNRIFKTVGFS